MISISSFIHQSSSRNIAAVSKTFRLSRTFWKLFSTFREIYKRFQNFNKLWKAFRASNYF